MFNVEVRRGRYILHALLLLIVIDILPCDVCGQDPDAEFEVPIFEEPIEDGSSFSYQVIVENFLNYYKIDKGSKLNPGNNYMNLEEFNYDTRLFPILELAEGKNKIHFEPRIRIGSIGGKDSVEILVQELYSAFNVTEKLYVVIGKQRINWGSALIWNPTNFFIQKDPLRTNNRLDGLFAARVEYFIAPFTANLIVAPMGKIKRTNIAMRVESTLNLLSYSLSYAYVGESSYQYGVDFSYGGDYFTLFGEGILKNFSAYRYIDDNGILQYRPKVSGFQKLYREFVVGGSITPTALISLNLEYHYKGDHNSLDELDHFESGVPVSLPAFDGISMGKHTFFGSFNIRNKYERFTVRSGAFFDPTSKQLTISPGFIYTKNKYALEWNAFLFGKSLGIYNYNTRLILSLYF